MILLIGDVLSYFSILEHLDVKNILDILIVSYIFYKVYNLLKKTRGAALVKGLLLLLVLMKISELLGLVMLFWIVKNALTLGVISLVVIFQPELRKTLEHLGKSRFFTGNNSNVCTGLEAVVEEVVNTAADLAETKTGMLVVFERNVSLREYADKGVQVDAIVSSPLLGNIFIENTPLHDGAVIISGERVLAASCVLPLTEQDIKRDLGTRHRAAIGITEHSDALTLVVSEETGVISIAIDGRLHRGYNQDTLKTLLARILIADQSRRNNSIPRRVSIWLKKVKKKLK